MGKDFLSSASSSGEDEPSREGTSSWVSYLLVAIIFSLANVSLSAAIPPIRTGIRVEERDRQITANAFGFGRPGKDLVVLIDETSVTPQLLDVLSQQLSMLNARFNTTLRLRVKFVSYGVQGLENPELSVDDLTDFAPLRPQVPLITPSVAPSVAPPGSAGNLFGALDWVVSRSSWTPFRVFPEVDLAVLLVSRDVSGVSSEAVTQIKAMLGGRSISLTIFGVDGVDGNAAALAGADARVLTLGALKTAGNEDRSLLVPLFGTDEDRWTISVVTDAGLTSSDFDVADLAKTVPRNLSWSTSLVRFDKQLTEFPAQWVFPVKALFGEQFAKREFSVFLTFSRSGEPLASTEAFRYRLPRFSVYEWYLDGPSKTFFPVVSAGINVPITVLPQAAKFLGISGFPTASWVKVTQPQSPIFSINTQIRTQTYGASLMVRDGTKSLRQQGVLQRNTRGSIRLFSPSFKGGIGMIGFNRYAFIKQLSVTDGINSIDLDGGADLFDYSSPRGRIPSVGPESPYSGYTIGSGY